MSAPIQVAMSILLDAADWMHVIHLKTLNYSEHKVLNDYYLSLVSSADRFVEQVLGNPAGGTELLSEAPDLVRNLQNEDSLVYSETIIEALKNIADHHVEDTVLQSTLYDILGDMYGFHYLLKRAKSGK